MYKRGMNGDGSPSGAPRHDGDFGALALGHLKALYNFACAMASSPADAEDLVQTTFAKALRNQSRYLPGTDIRAWLFRVLRNEFIDRCRGDRRRALIEGLTPDGELPDLAAPEGTPEEIVSQRFEARDVRAALESLPESLRLTVYLRDVEGLEYRAIASTLGCPIGTVMSRLNRGRAAIRARLLAARGEGDERG